MAQNPKEKQKRVPSGFVLARNSGKTLGRQASPAELIFSARCLAEASVRGLDSRVLKKKQPSHGNQDRGEEGNLHFSVSCLLGLLKAL